MKLKYIILFLVTVTISCKSKNTNPEKILKIELKELTTDELKKEYLEQILVDDQKVRGSRGQELMLQFGKDSKEHMEYIHEQWRQDSINLEKIETYLTIHGYPDKSFGDKATTTPWMIIHHSQGYQTRDDNFKTIYQAYINGNIDDGAISFYLGRMYQMKFGKRLKMESPYISQDEINKLISELNLLEKKKEVIGNSNANE